MTDCKWPQHKPGPWEVEHHRITLCESQWSVYALPRYPCDQPVACGFARDIGKKALASSEANARLIAAAPQLFEALQTARSLLRQVFPDSQLCLLDEAIAAATGHGWGLSLECD